MLKICIDPGHGGSDPGAVSGAAQEKQIALSIGMELKQELERLGFETFMTRKSDIYDTPYQKAQKGNQARADYFISIHCNSAQNSHAEGTETLAFDSTGESGKLAGFIQNSLISATGLADRGVKLRKDLIVLNTTSMPAVLVETAFLSNEREKYLLLQTDFQRKTALAIAEGVQDFIVWKEGKQMEKMTAEEAKRVIQEKCNFDENTMKYLEFYRYADSMLIRLAEKMK